MYINMTQVCMLGALREPSPLGLPLAGSHCTLGHGEPPWRPQHGLQSHAGWPLPAYSNFEFYLHVGLVSQVSGVVVQNWQQGAM